MCTRPSKKRPRRICRYTPTFWCSTNFFFIFFFLTSSSMDYKTLTMYTHTHTYTYTQIQTRHVQCFFLNWKYNSEIFIHIITAGIGGHTSWCMAALLSGAVLTVRATAPTASVPRRASPMKLMGPSPSQYISFPQGPSLRAEVGLCCSCGRLHWSTDSPAGGGPG